MLQRRGLATCGLGVNGSASAPACLRRRGRASGTNRRPSLITSSWLGPALIGTGVLTRLLVLRPDHPQRVQLLHQLGRRGGAAHGHGHGPAADRLAPLQRSPTLRGGGRGAVGNGVEPEELLQRLHDRTSLESRRAVPVGTSYWPANPCPVARPEAKVRRDRRTLAPKPPATGQTIFTPIPS